MDFRLQKGNFQLTARTSWQHQVVTNYAGKETRLREGLQALSPVRPQPQPPFGTTGVRLTTVTATTIAGQTNPSCCLSTMRHLLILPRLPFQLSLI
jgi:hypothetical protein